MDKSQTIDALIRLSKDKSTTKAERDAAKAAIKALTGNENEPNDDDVKLAIPSSSKAIETAKFKMQPWIEGHDDRPWSRVERLQERLLPDRRRTWHGALMEYEIYRQESESTFQRDGFVFRIYGGLGFQNIWVVINDPEDVKLNRCNGPSEFDRQSDNFIQIYDGHRTGWRDGPWWNKLDTITDKWIVEADALDAERAREAARKKQAEIDKENDIFSKYMRQQ
jgi:hypothetical protein